jgi:hypothetical protein
VWLSRRRLGGQEFAQLGKISPQPLPIDRPHAQQNLLARCERLQVRVVELIEQPGALRLHRPVNLGQLNPQSAIDPWRRKDTDSACDAGAGASRQSHAPAPSKPNTASTATPVQVLATLYRGRLKLGMTRVRYQAGAPPPLSRAICT